MNNLFLAIMFVLSLIGFYQVTFFDNANEEKKPKKKRWGYGLVASVISLFFVYYPLAIIAGFFTEDISHLIYRDPELMDVISMALLTWAVTARKGNIADLLRVDLCLIKRKEIHQEGNSYDFKKW